MSLCSLPLSGCGQEDELGHEEDVLPVEGPGAGGDQHCSPLQFPGSAGALAAKPQSRAIPFRALGPKGQEPSLPGTTSQGDLFTSGVRHAFLTIVDLGRGPFEKEMTHREAVTCLL